MLQTTSSKQFHRVGTMKRVKMKAIGGIPWRLGALPRPATSLFCLLLAVFLLVCDNLGAAETQSGASDLYGRDASQLKNASASSEALKQGRRALQAGRQLRQAAPLAAGQIEANKSQQEAPDENDEFEQTIGSQLERPRRPKFIVSSPEELIVYASSYQNEAYLPCKIANLDEDQTVSWIRRRDSLVLSVDKLRLVDDARLKLAPTSDDWTLAIAQPSERDAGLYECQVSSMEPKLSQLVELRHARAESYIGRNFSSLFVRPGERLELVCSIEAPRRTLFVYWYKNKEPIQFDTPKLSARQKRSNSAIETSEIQELEARQSNEQQDTRAKLVRCESKLVIRSAQMNDTANYTCLPSNAKPSHVNVVVIENGQETQPEKRSLHAASDGALITRDHFLKDVLVLLETIRRIATNCWWSDVAKDRNKEQHDEHIGIFQTALVRAFISQDFVRFLIPTIVAYWWSSTQR